MHYLNNVHKLCALKVCFYHGWKSLSYTVISPYIKKEQIFNFSIIWQASEMLNRKCLIQDFRITIFQSMICQSSHHQILHISIWIFYAGNLDRGICTVSFKRNCNFLIKHCNKRTTNCTGLYAEIHNSMKFCNYSTIIKSQWLCMTDKPLSIVI